MRSKYVIVYVSNDINIEAKHLSVCSGIMVNEKKN